MAAGEEDIRTDVEVAVAGGVGQAGLVQELLVGQPEAGDAGVLRPGECLQDGVAQQALGHGRWVAAVGGVEVGDRHPSDGQRRLGQPP